MHKLSNHVRNYGNVGLNFGFMRFQRSQRITLLRITLLRIVFWILEFLFFLELWRTSECLP